MNEILMFSGGMDSLCAWWLRGRPRCIFVSGHSRYSWKESQAVTRLQEALPDLVVSRVSMPFLLQFEEEDANIPLRNSYFAHIGSHFGNHVLIPCQRGEQSIPDRGPAFFQQESDLLSLLWGKRINVDPVFPALTKQDVVAQYLRASGDSDTLHLTYSCSSPKPGRCGQCSMCFRTAIALDYNSILPLDFFQQDIWSWEGVRRYLLRSDLEPRRQRQTLEVLARHGYTS